MDSGRSQSSLYRRSSFTRAEGGVRGVHSCKVATPARVRYRSFASLAFLNRGNSSNLKTEGGRATQISIGRSIKVMIVFLETDIISLSVKNGWPLGRFEEDS